MLQIIIQTKQVTEADEDDDGNDDEEEKEGKVRMVLMTIEIQIKKNGPRIVIVQL